MDKRSKTVLFIILSLIVLTGLFPPWKYQTQVTYGKSSINIHGSSLHSFHFLLDPPTYSLFNIPIFATLNGTLDSQEITILNNAGSGYSVDLTRLAIIWSILLFIAVYLLAIINIKKTKGGTILDL